MLNMWMSQNDESWDIYVHLGGMCSFEEHYRVNSTYCHGNFSTLQTLNRHLRNYKCSGLKQIRATMAINAKINWAQVWKDILFVNKIQN